MNVLDGLTVASSAEGGLWPGSRSEETMREAAKRTKKILKCARELRRVRRACSRLSRGPAGKETRGQKKYF